MTTAMGVLQLSMSKNQLKRDSSTYTTFHCLPESLLLLQGRQLLKDAAG